MIEKRQHITRRVPERKRLFHGTGPSKTALIPENAAKIVLKRLYVCIEHRAIHQKAVRKDNRGLPRVSPLFVPQAHSVTINKRHTNTSSLKLDGKFRTSVCLHLNVPPASPLTGSSEYSVSPQGSDVAGHGFDFLVREQGSYRGHGLALPSPATMLVILQLGRNVFRMLACKARKDSRHSRTIYLMAGRAGRRTLGTPCCVDPFPKFRRPCIGGLLSLRNLPCIVSSERAHVVLREIRDRRLHQRTTT